MADITKIEWTHRTFNPWWGCTRISRGCKRCFAAQIGSYRQIEWGSGNYGYQTDKYWKDPIKWNKNAQKSGKFRIFCASMCDIFEGKEEHQPHLARLWKIIDQTPNLTWQLLTKRPENIMDLIPVTWTNGCFPGNVQMGVTVEDRATVNRVHDLIKIPAGIRFLSLEPMVEPPDIEEFLKPPDPQIHWVIVGGETGPGAQRLKLNDVKNVYMQCKRQKTPFFFKQWGGKDKTRVLFNRTWSQFPA
jgi:protein gp37